MKMYHCLNCLYLPRMLIVKLPKQSQDSQWLQLHLMENQYVQGQAIYGQAGWPPEGGGVEVRINLAHSAAMVPFGSFVTDDGLPCEAPVGTQSRDA